MFEENIWEGKKGPHQYNRISIKKTWSKLKIRQNMRETQENRKFYGTLGQGNE